MDGYYWIGISNSHDPNWINSNGCKIGLWSNFSVKKIEDGKGDLYPDWRHLNQKEFCTSKKPCNSWPASSSMPIIEPILDKLTKLNERVVKTNRT